MDELGVHADGILMDEGTAVRRRDVDIGDRRSRKRVERLAEIERYLEAAGEEVHRAGRQDASTLPVFISLAAAPRRAAVAAADQHAVDRVVR